MNLTKEKVLEIQHELLNEMSIWEFANTDREAAQFAFFQSGVLDMTNAILRAIQDGGEER